MLLLTILTLLLSLSSESLTQPVPGQEYNFLTSKRNGEGYLTLVADRKVVGEDYSDQDCTGVDGVRRRSGDSWAKTEEVERRPRVCLCSNGSIKCLTPDRK